VRRIVLKVAKEAEPALYVCLSRRVDGVVVHARWWTWNFAVVGIGIEVQDCKALFEQVDAWYE
jgi:hypothetical protein